MRFAIPSSRSVVEWAKTLYADPGARSMIDGIGVHWYGGLNTHNLESTHEIAPDKFILATEACNCPGVVYRHMNADEWWQRAEHLGMDILQDLLHWSIGWVDWNLILDVTGGPNHLGNRCDANIIADPKQKLKQGSTLIFQASFYYMGHFSQYIPALSKRIKIANHVVEEKELTVNDVANGQPLVFLPCSGSGLQSFTLDNTGSIVIEKTSYQCLDVSNWGVGPRIDTYSCAHSPNQKWERRISPKCTNAQVKSTGVACTQFVNPASGKCLTKKGTSGSSIGLDAGSTYIVAQALPCTDIDAEAQTFSVVHGDGQGFPHAFPVRSLANLANDDPLDDRELCLQPYIAKESDFDAVAFVTPDGGVSVVAMNKGKEALTFSIYDVSLGAGASNVTVPPHSIQSYRLPAAPSAASPAASPAGEPVASPAAGGIDGLYQEDLFTSMMSSGADPADHASATVSMWPLTTCLLAVGLLGTGYIIIGYRRQEMGRALAVPTNEAELPYEAYTELYPSTMYRTH